MVACNICGTQRAADAQTASVRCNVRRFSSEHFDVWRCSSCQSIHATDQVDLEHYYSGYPVHAANLDWRLNVVYGSMLRRLQAAGLDRSRRILDYGCGSGVLVQFLKARGYDVVGYDRFSEGFDDPAILEASYGCIVCQDVIEHVDDPLALLSQFGTLIDAGGIISIGTPDAAVLSLDDPEDYVHSLHAPYHRHILSVDALKEAGLRCGWKLERHHPTMYNNTLFPTMNPRFALFYVRALDDVYDLVTEPPRVDSWLLWTPQSLFFAVLGYFFDRHTDIQVVFRAPAS